MKALLHIAARSALNRRGTLALVVLSIALATALLLSLERLRTDIRSSFAWPSAAPTWWWARAPGPCS
jgi:putative ABC transport system permease protein